MSFLYRVALTITRRPPYIDWANSFDDDGLKLTVELAGDHRTVYLAPESDKEPDLAGLLDEFWLQIFEEELSAWRQEEEEWPTPLTRDMFEAWFGAELTDSVFDLTPEEPLTQTDVEAADLTEAVQHCAWCGIELDEGAGRFVSFELADRGRVACITRSLPVD